MEDEERIALEAEKLRRENEKLAAETRLLNRPWCLQASYIAAILPIIALCGTCFIAYRDSAAYRDAQEARRETARARADRDSFRKQVADLRREKDELERGKKALETQRDQVAQQVKDLDSGLKARGTVEGLAASAMKGSKQAFEGLQEIASGSQADLRRLAQSWVESVVSKFSLYSSPAPAGEGSPGTHGMSVVVGGREKWVEQTSTACFTGPAGYRDPQVHGVPCEAAKKRVGCAGPSCVEGVGLVAEGCGDLWCTACGFRQGSGVSGHCRVEEVSRD
jgi:hypothetical protein